MVHRGAIRGMVAVLGILMAGTHGIVAADLPLGRGLGDAAVDAQWYDNHRLEFDVSGTGLLLPGALDWRWWNMVTLPKDQGACGSSWAFAAVATLESKLLLWRAVELDLSEQQLISGASEMAGCCGGNMKALQFYRQNPPSEESCAGYCDTRTVCPPTKTVVPYETIDHCLSPVDVDLSGLYTVDTAEVEQVKLSLYFDGPAYLRFDVHESFLDYWRFGSADEVYHTGAGRLLGGQAVLLIGWDDEKDAWLCQNSWGRTGGPANDGTFWLAYRANSRLTFQMASLRPPCDKRGTAESQCLPALSQDHDTGRKGKDFWQASCEDGTGALSRALHGQSFAGRYQAQFELEIAQGCPTDPPDDAVDIELVEDWGQDCAQGNTCGLVIARKRLQKTGRSGDILWYVLTLPGDPCFVPVTTRIWYEANSYEVRHHQTCLKPSAPIIQEQRQGDSE